MIRLQLSVYRGNSGIQAMMNSNARRLAEQDESALIASGVPYTIIRVGSLKNTPGRQRFSFEKVLLNFWGSSLLLYTVAKRYCTHFLNLCSLLNPGCRMTN